MGTVTAQSNGVGSTDGVHQAPIAPSEIEQGISAGDNRWQL